MLKGCEHRMEKKKAFQVKRKRFTAASTVISLRLPKDMLEALDAAAAETGRTRNEFIALALEFALENLDVSES